MSNNVMTLKSGSKVIQGLRNRSTTYDFLLTFHSNHGPISRTVSEIDGDFSRKLQNFPTPCILRPLTGFPWNWVSAQGSEKSGMMGLPEVKTF